MSLTRSTSTPISSSPKNDNNGEVRYASLRRTFPDQTDVLMEKAKAFSAERYEKYRKLAEN